MGDPARPGSTYFVPGVRIMRLGELRAGPEEGVELTELNPDILRVEVTRVNTGSCQYCITLNNWFDTLPADRRAGFGQRELLRGAQPLWPRFKYNDFSVLNFGMRLRIDMRYFPDPIQGLSETDKAAQRWVPMIAGPITDMKFTFASGEGARLTVCGEDDLRLLKQKNKKKVDYWGVNEHDVITDVLRRVCLPAFTPPQVSVCVEPSGSCTGFPLPLSEPGKPWPNFVTGPARALAERHEEGQSFLEYLQKFADRFDFEVFIEFADLDDPGSGLTFHFEPARCRLPPDSTIRDIYVLERGRNLIEFTPIFKVLDQCTCVVVKGRHRVRTRPKLVDGVATPEILDDELHRDEARGDPPLVPGPEIRRRIYGDNPCIPNNVTNIDEERAEVMAEAQLRRSAREFLTIDGQTIGLPRLRPGFHAEIRGMRPPFDGFYYITKTVHTYGAEGLRTKFTGRRPGMPLPPYGEV